MVHGHLSHVPEGTLFDSRRALYDAGIHRDVRRPICDTSSRGAESVVLLPGASKDDADFGEIVYYTGQGGRDRFGQQIADQQLAAANANLARNADTLVPIRLVRAAPAGLRYDGLYRVEDAWISTGPSGHQLCRYRMAKAGTMAVPDTLSTTGEPTPAERRLVTHYRLARDGNVPQAVKRLYDFTCQICGVRLQTAAGPYAEGAHLVPLGTGNHGVDHLTNILCLCPNHHVLLDHGAIALTDDFQVIDRSSAVIGQLQLHPLHELDPAHAATHRRLLGFE